MALNLKSGVALPAAPPKDERTPIEVLTERVAKEPAMREEVKEVPQAAIAKYMADVRDILPDGWMLEITAQKSYDGEEYIQMVSVFDSNGIRLEIDQNLPFSEQYSETMKLLRMWHRKLAKK